MKTNILNKLMNENKNLKVFLENNMPLTGSIIDIDDIGFLLKNGSKQSYCFLDKVVSITVDE